MVALEATMQRVLIQKPEEGNVVSAMQLEVVRYRGTVIVQMRFRFEQEDWQPTTRPRQDGVPLYGK